MTPGKCFDSEFRQAFEERFESLFRYLDRLTADEALASDIAQETFVRLYRRGFFPADVRAWLVTVANNLLRDERRRSRRHQELLAGRRLQLMSSSEPLAPDADLVTRERSRQVRAALDALPLRERQILLLRHEGYSYREIALALKIRESSVGTYLMRAKASFRSSFESMHGAPD